MNDKQMLWSLTAKWGFQNEQDVIDIFNNWQNNALAKEWLQKMWYIIDEIEKVVAVKIKWNYKADIQIQVSITLKWIFDVQNISIKLVSNASGFNQIDKRWIDSYKELWNIEEEVVDLLKYFTWEKLPKISNSKDARRMFMFEFTEEEKWKILNFFENNKMIILTDILKWRWKFSAEWMLVIVKDSEKFLWALEPMNYVLNFYNGDVKISPQWSLMIWKITIQRKWWDGWRKTAQMLQFKFNPVLLINRS